MKAEGKQKPERRWGPGGSVLTGPPPLPPTVLVSWGLQGGTLTSAPGCLLSSLFGSPQICSSPTSWGPPNLSDTSLGLVCGPLLSRPLTWLLAAQGSTGPALSSG